MTPTPEVQERLRQYLLGQLTDDAREELEKELMASAELFAELLVVEDEIVDDYLGGRLKETDRASFEKDFLATPERQEKLRFGHAFERHLSSQAASIPIPKTSSSPVWAWTRSLFSSPLRIAVAAIIVVAPAIGVWQILFYNSEVDKGLLALNSAYREQRPVESRLSSLAYAPFSQTRGAPERVDALARNRAEAILSGAANDRANAAAHHGLGEVYLAKKQFDDAIKEFEEALKGDARNAQIYSDLGAAWFEKGKIDSENGKADPSSSLKSKEADDLGRSLENLNKALDLDPNLLPALFNRALCRQILTLFPQAEADWRKYLELDSTSPWADEARVNLARLQERKTSQLKTKQEVLEDFLNAQRASNDEKAWEVLSQTRDDLTGWAVARQLFEKFLTAASSGNKDDTDASDKALTYVADLERERSDEYYSVELLRRYRQSNAGQRQQVISAHASMETGYEYYRRSQLAEAADSFQRAQQSFSAAGDREESSLAQYWEGYCLAEAGDTKKALAIFEPLAEHFTAQHYRCLLMRTLNSIANAKFALNEYSEAIEYCHRSLDLSVDFDRIGTFNAVDTLIEFYRSLNNRQQSLGFLVRGLPLVDCCRFNPIKLWRHYAIVASALESADLYDAALEFQQAALQQALVIGDPFIISVSYANLGSIYGKTGEFDKGVNYAQLGYESGATMADKREAKGLMAYARLQLGDLFREEGKPDQAIVSYQEAVTLYRDVEFPVLVYRAHKGLLEGYIAGSDPQTVAAQIKITLALTEQYRSTILEGDNRNGFFAAEQTVYDLATDFAYSTQTDQEQAFDYAEMSRARSLLDAINAQPKVVNNREGPELKFDAVSHSLSVTEIQKELPAGTQLVEYVVLSNKVLIGVISYGRPLVMEKSSIEQTKLEAKVREYLDYISRPPQAGNQAELLSKELYTILIKPIEPLLEREKQIVIVPDKALNLLSFASLLSPASNHFLIEDYCLSYAPSATVFLWATRKAAEKNSSKDEALLSVGNPRFDPEKFPLLENLPSATREATEIARIYHPAVNLIEDAAVKERIQKELLNADVVHFAAHVINQEASGLRAQLVLTKSQGPTVDRSENLEAHEIYGLALPKAKLVVLSACRSGMDRAYAGEGAISLARPFLVSGVPIVVASLWPVDSEASAQLMIDFHKQRVNGHISSARALREAQLAMLRGSAEFQSPYYWAPFFLTGGYADF